jgi:hypothetical protein
VVKKGAERPPAVAEEAVKLLLREVVAVAAAPVETAVEAVRRPEEVEPLPEEAVRRPAAVVHLPEVETAEGQLPSTQPEAPTEAVRLVPSVRRIKSPPN